MTEKTRRICIFCGAPPEGKTKEHPLPKWLLSMTGDPNRVVSHGYRWTTGKVFAFAFDQLHFPACSSCNSRYAAFEQHAKEVVECISRKEAATPNDYVHLLDWLDKVRIGLWLGHRYLQQNRANPHFTIDSRLGMKDRMLAVYTIGDQQKGLNTWGPESRLFQIKPSVFALRVNNILFLNASWDYMCSHRCGYPYPRRISLAREQSGMLAMSDFRSKRKVTHPVMSKLMKSCVTIFQPVLQSNADGSITALTQKDIDYHLDHAWPGRNGLGPLYRQLSGETREISYDDAPLGFDSISPNETNRAVDIATQAYELQNESVRMDPRTFVDGAKLQDGGFMKACVKENGKIMHAIRNMSTEKYEEARLKFIAGQKPQLKR